MKKSMIDLFEKKNISPMLLHECDPFDDDDWIFELKLDGVRCIAYLDYNEVVLRNKRNKDVTSIYPELNLIYKCCDKKCILDGELIALKDGYPNFFELQKRSLMGNSFKIKLAAEKNPIQFVAYDILYFDNKEITELPLLERKSILDEVITESYGLSISRYVIKKGIKFFELAKERELEGVVAKHKNSLYKMGTRSKEWMKIKAMKDEDLIICGYQTDENDSIKALILGYYDNNGKLKCRGKVYSGISKSDKNVIVSFASSNSISYSPLDSKSFAQTHNTVWLLPKLVCTAHYMQLTEGGSMRQPTFKALRSDKLASECTVKSIYD